MISRNAHVTDGVVQWLLVMATVVWLCHSETLYFQPTNVDSPSLYQSMQLRFTGWSALSGDPTMQTGDFMYMVGVAATSCTATAPSSANNFPVTVDGSQSFATATLVVSPNIFTVGEGYAACYVSTETGEGYITKRSQVVDDVVVETSFVVLSSIYPSNTVTPTMVYAGQGLIAVSITESDERANGRSLNQGGVGGLRPYFLACSPNCGDYATLVALCGTTSGVTFASIDGYSTTTLQGTFTAPQQPSSGGYAICVPYCYSSTAGCAQASYPMSWAIVTSTALVVQGANPSVYFVAPANPTVRMSSTMNFTGSGLTASDRIKIIEAGGSCSSTSSALLGNVNYNQAVVLLNTTSASTAFASLNLIATSIVGQVCYARGGGTIFAPVYQTTTATASDFVVLPMQPANFSTTPTSPSLGQSFAATFRGTGLDATQDLAYFVTSSSSTCTVTSSSDLCDGTTTNARYTCVLSGGATPSCTITADPDTNSATTLCGCYRVSRSNNYAMVSGSILLSARNPVYSLSPYPVYAGQAATLLFSGSGITASDTVAFVPSTSTCDGVPVTNVSAYNPSSNSSTAAAFTISGPGNLCLRVCYKFQGSTTWVISRPSSPISIDASCAATLLYISPFSMRFALSPTNPTARATVAATLSGSAQTAVALVVVPAIESCVLVSCGAGSVCAQAALAADYFSGITSSSALFAITRTSSQVLCVSLGSTFIPVLSTGTTYTFDNGAQNPSAYVPSPLIWRVAMSNLNATFTGTLLNATTDIVRALDGASLLSSKGVCPREASIVTTVLTATAYAGSSATSTTFAFQGADTLTAQSAVHLCYYRGVAGSRIASYVGSMNVLPQNPANVTASGTLRAGEVISLTFAAATSSTVTPASDALTFYQFQASTIAPTCRCDAASCSSAVATTTTSIALTGSSSSSVWRNPLGFGNLASNAVYVVCYTVDGAGSPTYTGQIAIAQSHPSYYTLGSTAYRVGLPVTVTVSTLCSTCSPLNASDDIILVLNASNCADVSGMSANEAQAATAVQYNDPNTLRSLVPLVQGHFRVCYKKVGATAYQELTFSSQFSRTLISVGPADPASFAPVPAAPTAGQYLIVNLTSCSAAVCSTCAAVRLIPGTAASCWTTPAVSYASSSCVGSATLYQFPNQFLPAGSYTMCFGDTVISRVPGTLTIAAANPSAFTAPSVSIFTNQGSRATLALSGSGLSSSDSIFVLPNVSTYSCHDLRDSQINIRLNATYAGWWSPSTSPYSITGSGTAVTWVASDSLKRFSAEIIASIEFCSNLGVSCALQVCYLRQGTSWAPVTMSGGTTLTLLPANPQTVAFDVSGALRVTQYVLATVTGTALTASDTLYFSDGLCELLSVVATTVSSATVSSDGKTWRGVIRFVGRNSGTVRGCYVSGQTTTEIPNIPSIASIQGQLYYLKQSTWNEAQTAGSQSHALTQYETVYMAGTTSASGTSQIPNVASMNLVRSTDECNYEPYRPNAYELQVNLSRVDGQTSYFLGRLYRQGTFALCLNTSGLLFRIVASIADNAATSIAVLSPNPASFALSPTTPFAGQFFSVSIQFNTTLPSFERRNATGDMVRVISGGLESCGFLNATTIVNVTLNATGAAVVSLPAATAGANHTLCYRTYNGSFATVPRLALVDRNIAVAAAYPLYFSTLPRIPQSTVSLNLTFYSNSTGPLLTSDRAYLVRISNTSRLTPVADDCTQVPTLSAATIGGVTASTSVWSIPASANLVPGNYTVCYVVTANGQGSVVPNPGFLVVVERQSPYGAETDSVGGLSIYNGERIRLFFLSNVSLLPALPWDSAAGSDQVVFSANNNCVPALDRTQVAAIPSAFGYSTPTRSGSFLHVRFRTTGTFYVCMKRAQRLVDQQYYHFDAVGGPDQPVRLTILGSPIQSALLHPAIPRVAVPDVVAIPTFASGFSSSSLQLLFASAYANGTTADSITEDSCYYPPSTEANVGAVLVNTTLGFSLPNLTALYAFPASGRYVLCYSIPLRTIASLPLPFTVAAMSPIYYTVPDLIAPGTSFSMALRATDAIFASVVNVATVVPYNGIVSCRGAFAAATGTSNFTSIAGNATVSSVEPLLPQQGSYYVCFKAYDQVQYFAVPNVVGGYVFGVGNVGPTSYTVDPSPRYAAQRLTLSIAGNLLRAADTAKIVNVTSVSSSEYFTICSNSSTPDVNALNPSGGSGAGTNVSFGSTVAVTLTARVMSRGTYILCYRGATNAWAYVPDVVTFTVGGPFPSAYITSPLVAYATQSVVLSIRHTAGGLTAGDDLRLVQRGSANNGFDCTEAAVALLPYTNVSSSSTERNVSLCASSAASVTVCFKVFGGTWAEVPFYTGFYQALAIAANPLDIASLHVSRSPRPLETFTITLSTAVAGLTLQRALVVPYTTSTCNATIAPITPLFVNINEMTITTAIAASGAYTLMVGLSASGPLIAIATAVIVAPCDPCTLSPLVMFTETTYTTRFPSTSNTFNVSDTVRIVPASTPLSTPSLCTATTNWPFGATTFAATNATTTSLSSFSVATPAGSAGMFYVCYRKNTTTDFAVVASSLGAPVVLQIVVPEPSSIASTCPSTLYGGQGTTILLESTSPTLVPLSSSDAAFLVPSSTTCDAAPQATLALFAATGRNASFDVVLPSQASTQSYRLCYVHALDTRSRSVGIMTVNARDPLSFSSEPANVSVGLTDINISFHGSSLAASDSAFFVSNVTSCVEYCRDRPIALSTLSPPFTTETSQLPTTFVVQLNGSFATTGSLKVCYRRSGGTLAQLPSSLVIAAANPSIYTTNFVPRKRTRPTLNFTGTLLGASDAVKVVPLGAVCSSAASTVMGSFVSAAVSQQWATFHVPLVAPIEVGVYTVCYNVGGIGWIPVAPSLQVLEGGPTFFNTTNAPMAGRALTLSFDEQNFTSRYGLGDDVLITCGTCSCWEDGAAMVAYGNATTTVGALAAPTALRVGFQTGGTSYRVCYRLADSGFGLVASMLIAAPSPISSQLLPTPSAFRGQRLNVSVFGGTRSIQYSTGDQIMLSSPSRGCWEPATATNSDVYSITSVSLDSTTIGTTEAHIPSLGPTAAASVLPFPLNATVCFKEHGQPEYLHVPFPVRAVYPILPADPRLITTIPSLVREGMINVSVSFVTSSTSTDQAMAVVGVWGDRICDAPSSIPISANQDPVGFLFTALHPGGTSLQGANVTLCYTRSGGTIAEVPQQIVVAPRNPSSFSINTTSPRNREYIALSVYGTGLSSSNTQLRIIAVPCLEGAAAASASVTGRIGTISGGGAQLNVTVQLLFPSAAFTAYVCAFYGGAWSQLGSFGVMDAAPQFLTTSPPLPRVGQHVVLTLTTIGAYNATRAAVLSTTGDQSWCHNFTVLLEPSLTLSSATEVFSNIWAASGLVRLCMLKDSGLWADVDDSRYNASSIAVLPPNPTSLWTYPQVARVGQRVVLSFAVTSASFEDQIILADAQDPLLATIACDAPAMLALARLHPTRRNATTVEVQLNDTTDSLMYRSFATTATWRVCYYSDAEMAWGVVGGTLPASTWSVLPQSPFRWYQVGGKLVAKKSAVIGFVGILNTLAAANVAWFVPVGTSCAVRVCDECMDLPLDPSTLNATSVQTQPFSPRLDGNYSICYTLADSTAAMVAGILSIATSDIQCVVEETVQIGRRQNLTLRKLPNVNTTLDAMQFSVYGSTTGVCNATVLPDFPSARAQRVAETSTSVTYSLEWPVTMNLSRYTMCYFHEGESGNVCTCNQFDSRSAECFLTTTAPKPSSFGVSPQPSYVGQSITLSILRDATTVLDTVVLVPYATSNLSTCRSSAANGVMLSSSVEIFNTTTTLFRFKHNYDAGANTFIVCGRLQGETELVRLPTHVNALQVLALRPYVALTTLPQNALLHRAFSTIQLTINHVSTMADDVLTSTDVFTFVRNPYWCNESYIDGNSTHSSEFLAAVSMDDSTVLGSTSVMHRTGGGASTSYITFNILAVGGAPWYMCYKLSGATWSVVDNPIAVLPAVFDRCIATPRPSTANNDVTGALRAMQYIPVLINGSTISFATLQTSLDDIRVVAASSPCFNDTSSMFVPSKPFLFTNALLTTVVWSPVAGNVKVCYRFGGPSASLFSPVCTIPLAAAVPAATTASGCKQVGQTLSINASYGAPSTFVFAVQDALWFTLEPQCYYTNGTTAQRTNVVVVNFSSTATSIAPESSSAAITLPPLTLTAATSMLLLCYANANGSYFSVAIDSGVMTVVTARQPTNVIFGSAYLHVSQLIVGTFLGPGTPALRGNNVSMLPLLAPSTHVDSAGVAFYRTNIAEGSCAASDPTLYQASQVNSTVTSSALVPLRSGTHVACYRLASCVLGDVPLPFRVFEANPSSMGVLPAAPRKGQLLNITFHRVSNESDALMLSPGTDRAFAVDPATTSCWQLPAGAGWTTGGTALVGWTQTIFYADPPQSRTTINAIGCYSLAMSPSWSVVPQSSFVVLPANPSAFATSYTPMAYQEIRITFFGENFSAMDRAKVIPLSMNCSATSVPPSFMSAFGSDASASTMNGSLNGWAILFVDANTTVLNISSSQEGTFSVCYRLATDSVWTLVYDSLAIQPRNPELAVYTPVSALESEIFTVSFSRSNRTFSSALEMSASDQLELVGGANANCMVARNKDLIATGPSRTDLLVNYSFFQMASGTRGFFTLCYVRWINGMRVPTWGFPTVTILPNPTSFTTHTPAPLGNQYVGIIFVGFGLQSINGRVDQVKLLAATAPRTDLSCRTMNQTANVDMTAFRGFGNYSIQTVVARTAMEVIVCYKLYGGQFHVMPTTIAFGTQSPSLTIPLKVPLHDGEQQLVNVSFGTNGWRQGDYVYLSSVNCSERPVELLPSASDSASQFAYSSLLTQDAAGYMVGNVRPLVAGVYALCYRSPQSPISGVTTILQSVVQVSSGVPTVLTTALSYTAYRLVSITIPWLPSVASTGTYAAVVTQRSQCTGTAPYQALYADSTTWNATHMTTTGVFPAEGVYYLCTSNLIAPCGVDGRECARVVSTIVVSAAVPQGWTSLPLGSAFYSSDLVRLQFWLGSFALGTRVVLQGMSSIAPLNRTTIVNCRNTSTMRSVQLVEDAATATYAANVVAPGPYSVCAYLPDGGIGVFPNMHLTVQGSIVSTIELQTLAPTVVTTVVLEAAGNGLSSNDSLHLVRLPLRTSYSTALLATACANATEVRVPAAPTRVVFGATDMSWSALVPASANYAACYRFGYLGSQWTWTTAGGTIVTVAPVVTSVLIAAVPAYVNTPIVITLTGVSLASTDRIALVPVGSSCNGATASYVGTSQPTPSTIVGSLTVSATGSYTLCFASTVGVVSEPGTMLTVLPRVVVSAQFTATPACSEGMVCTTQPAVAMLDAGGNAAPDRGASISLSLRDASGNRRDEALTGNGTYALHSTGRFEFFTVGIRAAGTFVMTAFISLLGGQMLVAATSSFVVAQNNTLRTLSLSCVPSVFLMRVPGATNGTIGCTVAATSNFTAAAFAIGVSSGTASAPVASWGTNGFPRYTFAVTVPMQNYSQRFVTISVSTADPRYPGRVVDGSPAVVRIGTAPGNASLLSCSSNLKYNGVSYVRIGETAACSLQGRVVVNQTTYDVVSPSSYFAVSTTLGLAVFAVNLPTVPESLNGDYRFVSSVAVNVDRLVVDAYVLDDARNPSPATGSPQSFVVLRSPTTDSQMTCASISSGAVAFFIPGEGIRCTLLLRDAAGEVPTPSIDLLPTIDSGSVQYDGSSGGLITVVQFTAFAPLGVGGYQLPNVRLFAASASFQDQLFEIGVVHQPSSTQIATSIGTLVLVTAVVGGNNLVAGTEAALSLSGSGLSLLHTYLISPFASCDNNASTVAIPRVSVRSSTTAGDLLVSFTTPSYPFYLCFSPNGTDTWQLLLRGAFRNITVVAATSDGMASDDIILLVVGCVLLCILLLLLPFVCLRLRTKPVPSNRLTYIPRTNDQYIHRPVVSTPTMDTATPRGSLSLAPPPGGFKEDFEFSNVVQPHDETAVSETGKGERKKRKKKIDASIKKIATLQQLELDGKGSQEGSEAVGEEHTPPMPPPLQPHTSRPQEVRVVSVEERHTRQYSTNQYSPEPGHNEYSGFPPLDATSVFPTQQEGNDGFTPAQHQQAQQQQGVPATMMARPYVVVGHTSMQFASDGPTNGAV